MFELKRLYFDTKVIGTLLDVVLWLPWLGSYNLTVNWKEWHADVQHTSTSYRLSSHGSRDSTWLKVQAASKLDLL